MRLICFGDSWTMGHGVETDVKYKEIAHPKEGEEFIYKLRMCNGWPRWLANKWDCPFVAIGECGGTNFGIRNSIQSLLDNNFLQKDDLIIVMFSFPYRDIDGPIKNFKRIETLLKPFQHFYFNGFYPMFANENQFKTQTLPDYFISPTETISNRLREYEIANDISVWEYGSRSVYDDAVNYHLGDYHPNLLGYKIVAEYIYKEITNYKIKQNGNN